MQQQESPAKDVDTGSSTSESVKADRIATLAHDLRTPFMSIRGYTKMVLEERAGPINSTQREYLGIVAANTAKVLELLDELQKLALEEQLSSEPLDIAELWQEACELVRPRMEAKSLRMAQQLDVHAGTILADRQKLLDAFTEILSRMVTFADPGGRIFLTADCRNRDELYMTLSFSDRHPESGAEPLLNTDQFGKGLQRAQSVLRNHQGQLAVSKTGDGMLFVITLPMSRQTIHE